MRFRELRRRVDARLRGLELPDPFDVDQFAAQLAAERGRPLRFLPLPDAVPPNMPCAMWIRFRDEDVVYLETATTPWHREQLIAHELAHMICAHVSPLDLSTARRVAPGIDPATVQMMLGRTSYSTEQEREAETLATLILSRARRRHGSVPTARPDIADAIARASRAYWQPQP